MPSLQRLLLVSAVMLATIMEVLDMTIINVSLPNMAGELSATPTQMSWAMTAYILTAAIAMPLTGFCADRFGRKRYILLSISSFVVSSLSCALAHSLPTLVIFRLLQGISGAALVPISQAVMLELYPRQQHGKAMAIWGSGIMVAPIMGPVLGGWLTEHWSWRWAFLLNLPLGLIAITLIHNYMPDSPKQPRTMDWPGFITLLLTVSGIQYCLDQSHEADGLTANSTQGMAIVALLGLVGFWVHARRQNGRQLIFNLQIFQNRNFVLATLAMIAVSMALFGSITLQPLYFQLVLGFPSALTGQFMIPRGLASMLSMILVSQLINRIDNRWLILTGILLGISGTWCMSFYALDASPYSLIWPTLLQGLSMGFLFIPFNSLAYATLPASWMTEASGLYNLIRTLANAAGISVAMLLYKQELAWQWQHLIPWISIYNPYVEYYVQNLQLAVNDPFAMDLLHSILNQQTQALGLLNSIRSTCISFLLLIPFLLLFKHPNPNSR